MGLDKRPPLPAPTDISSADQASAVGINDFATDLSTRTDKTSYSIPEDGSPVTITTKKIRNERDQSQASLLIEYFEAGKSGEKARSRPSVRVRVTPSSSKRSKKAHDHIQITETTRDRKPSYTRRISLPGATEFVDGTEISELSENSSGRPPVEVEVLQHSELSTSDLAPTRFVPLPSEISTLPTDSFLDHSSAFQSPRKSRTDHLEEAAEAAAIGAAGAYAMEKVEDARHSRARSGERLYKKVAEKREKDSAGRVREKTSRTKERSGRSRSASQEYIADHNETTKTLSTRHRDDKYLDPGFQASEISGVSDRSMRSAHSATSINNPKLLGIVEDTIKRLILPELTALKEEQNLQKKRLKYEEITRDSKAPAGSREDLRRLSKTSSMPSVRRTDTFGEEREVIRTSESPRARKTRRSSRESTSDRSLETAVRDESSHSRRHSSGEKRRSHTKEAALAAGAAGAALGLTAANLRHHESSSSIDGKRERRKKHSSKSRSRTNSVSESLEEVSRREIIPPLPMQSMVESDITRDSILSADTERPPSRGSVSERTPIREIQEVSRGSPLHVISPARTPNRERTPASVRESIRHYEDRRSPASDRGMSKTKAAGLAAAGVAAGTALGAAMHNRRHHDVVDHDEYEEEYHNGELSPVQSDGSLRHHREELMEHNRIRSIKSGDSFSSARKAERFTSRTNDRSVPVSPNVFETGKRPQGISLEPGYEIMPEDEYGGTPVHSDVDDWLEREHEENEQYRSELSQLEPSELEHGHDSRYTDVSAAEEYDGPEEDARHLLSVHNRAEYIHTPAAVESAVASLLDPSNLSGVSSTKNSQISASKESKEAHVPLLEREAFRERTIQGVGVQRQPTTKERWEHIRDRAIASTDNYQEGGVVHGSPRHSESRSMDLLPRMGASAIPQPGDDMPEIGHGLDDESEMTTNPSIIQGPIGGMEHEDRSHWPYEPTPDPNSLQDREVNHTRDSGLLGPAAAAAAGAAIGLGVAHAQGKHVEPVHREFDSPAYEYQPHVEDDWESATHEVETGREPYLQQMYTPSPANQKDEGYQSAAHQSGLSPEPFRPGRGIDESSFEQYDEMGIDDPFLTQKHLRHESGLSHGMNSPLYDSATGKGVDRIQSRDIVALMDHLTVRDAQRNARDTEILVTLVRSAAEMRNSFEEMKRYIAEQDKMILQNADRNADMTVQRVINGPRPFPAKDLQASRSQTSEEDDVPGKRRNLLRRALKGLGGRNTSDLAKIEGMLMRLLSEVEGLKDGPGMARAPTSQASPGSLNSYENLRNAQDPGYEPEGQAGTSSTPNQSGYLSNSSSRRFDGAMHSGYERRGSDGHRISTVIEEDPEDHQQVAMSPYQEDYEDEDDRALTPTQDERSLTPTQDARPRNMNQPALDTPPEQASSRFHGHNSMSTDETPKTDKSRKHKSNTSSIFSIFKPGNASRWSKTTTSSVPEAAPFNASRKDDRRMTSASRSGSDLDLTGEHYADYGMHEDDRIRSQGSLLSQRSQQRSASPLIPEEDEYEDAKYQAHRNSLNLQHPQPRQGPTYRHQNHLESQAVDYAQPPTPDADQWGSAPALAMNRNRYSGASTQTGGNMSPVYSDGGYSAHSASEQAHAPQRPPKIRDDGPLVPPKEPVRSTKPSSSGYENVRSSGTVTSASGQQTFPYGSPMLDPSVHIPNPLEPIQEVRYSLETDQASLRQQLTPSPRPTAMQSVARKITGPREMPASMRSSSGHLSSPNTRRKPVGSGKSPGK